jgi:hypothetical protein
VFKKVRRDYSTALGMVAILLGLVVLGGITYTYTTRPELREAAVKRVQDIRQMFEEHFR